MAKQKSLIVLQENTGRIDLPGGVSTNTAALIYHMIDHIAEKFEDIKGQLQALGHYNVVHFLTDVDCTRQKLLDTLVNDTRLGRTIDLITIGHGNTGSLGLHGGEDLDSDAIRSLLTDAQNYSVQPVDSLNLRLVYMCNCRASTLNDDWLSIGAKVSIGSHRNNYLPEPAITRFVRNWTCGRSAKVAAQDAYRISIPFYSPFFDTQKIEGSAPIVGGDPYCTIHSYPGMDTYRITVTTGSTSLAGTDADVFIRLKGMTNSTEFSLDNPGDDREKGDTDVYYVAAEKIGDLREIELRLDGSSISDRWYLAKVMIQNMHFGYLWEFPCNDWLKRQETYTLQCLPTRAGITLYEHADCSGGSQFFTADATQFTTSFNDKVSSMSIHGNVAAVTLYRHADFQRPSVQITDRVVDDFNNLRFANGTPLNDEVSSVKVHFDGFSLFEHAYGEGDSIFAVDDVPSLSALSINLNDQASSALLHGKVVALTLYSEAHFQGPWAQVTDRRGDNFKYITFSDGSRLNDRVSSVKVHYDGVMLFEDTEYQGRSYFAASDVASLNSLRYSLGNRISSLVLHGNVIAVTLFRDTNHQGPWVQITDRKMKNLGDIKFSDGTSVNGRVSSVKVDYGGVRLFQHAGYAGASVLLTDDEPALNAQGIDFDERASSMQMQGKVATVTFYRDLGFHGPSIQITDRKIDNFKDLEFGDGTPVNDRVSSVRVA